MQFCFHYSQLESLERNFPVNYQSGNPQTIIIQQTITQYRHNAHNARQKAISKCKLDDTTILKFFRFVISQVVNTNSSSHSKTPQNSSEPIEKLHTEVSKYSFNNFIFISKPRIAVSSCGCCILISTRIFITNSIVEL